jgi:hypothetical protein
MAMGGRRAGAGRPKGVPNKANSDLKAAAQAYTGDALATLAKIMGDEKQPGPARVSAANALLDRGHGRAMQPVQHELDLSNLTDEQLGILAAALGAAPEPGEGARGDREAATAH